MAPRRFRRLLFLRSVGIVFSLLKTFFPLARISCALSFRLWILWIHPDLLLFFSSSIFIHRQHPVPTSTCCRMWISPFQKKKKTHPITFSRRSHRRHRSEMCDSISCVRLCIRLLYRTYSTYPRPRYLRGKKIVCKLSQSWKRIRNSRLLNAISSSSPLYLAFTSCEWTAGEWKCASSNQFESQGCAAFLHRKTPSHSPLLLHNHSRD